MVRVLRSFHRLDIGQTTLLIILEIYDSVISPDYRRHASLSLRPLNGQVNRRSLGVFT